MLEYKSTKIKQTISWSIVIDMRRIGRCIELSSTIVILCGIYTNTKYNVLFVVFSYINKFKTSI
jgi:hypothetical protein